MGKKRIRTDLYGAIGSSIEGSALFRDYCVQCHEPIRVTNAGKPNWCLECNPTGRQISTGGTQELGDINYHGSRFHDGEW